MRWLTLLFLVVTTACATAAPSAAPASQPAPVATSAVQKPLVIALGNEPRVLDSGMTSGANGRDYAAFFNAYLAYHQPDGKAMPYLAAELPTIENGSWKVFPDGHMETTYQLKQNAQWHDGQSITAGDFAFAFRVRTDPAIGMEFVSVERMIAEVRAMDEHTLFISWSQPYIFAGEINNPYFSPMAEHVLEPIYEADKDGFLNSPYLRDQFVGSGPYRIERWDKGSELVLKAHDGFALGKPKIDEVTIRIIPDGNTIVANLLSGTVDMAWYQGLGFLQGQALEQGGFDGTVENWRGTVRFLQFQTRDWGNLEPSVLDVHVRRATVLAIDRSAIVDGLYGGKTEAPYFWMSPGDSFYRDIEPQVTELRYDPAAAEAELRQAGWTRGADGLARNSAGQPLTMPMLNQSGDIELQEGSVVLNNWKAVGITGDMTQMTPAQDRDGELRTKFPGVAYDRRGIGYDSMVWVAKSVTRAETRWAGQNRNGYVNPVLEQNWSTALATVNPKEREGYFAAALKAMTEDAVVNPTHLQPRPMAYRRGLTGMVDPWVEETAQAWNPWQWRWQ